MKAVVSPAQSSGGCVSPDNLLFKCRVGEKWFELAVGKDSAICLNRKIGLVVGGGGVSGNNLTLCPKGIMKPYNEAGDECDMPILIKQDGGFHVFETTTTPSEEHTPVKCNGGQGYVSNGRAILNALAEGKKPPAYVPVPGTTESSPATPTGGSCPATGEEIFACTFSGGMVRIKPITGKSKEVCVNDRFHVRIAGGSVERNSSSSALKSFSMCASSATGKDQLPFQGGNTECEDSIKIEKKDGKWFAALPGSSLAACTGGSLWVGQGQEVLRKMVESP